MFRFSLTVCVSLLICGISAKPYQPWKEVADAAFQETNVMMSKDIGGKLFYGLEVEPPQDMDVTDYDFHPSMAIWKSMMTATAKEEDQHRKAAAEEEEEGDVDELHPPSMAELLRARLLERGAVVVGEAFRTAAMADGDDYYEEAEAEAEAEAEEPEPDWDAVYQGVMETMDKYLAPLAGGGRVHHAEPEEEDRDDLDHPVQPAPLGYEAVALGPEVEGQTGVRVHLEPEEDMDDLDHPELPVADGDAPVPVQLPADWSSQRKYDQPEEDLDEVYHQS